MIITHSGVRTNQKTFIVAGHLFHFSGCSVLRENFYDELRALPSRTLPCPKRSLHRRSSSRKHPKETHVCNKAYLLFFPHSPSKPPKKGPWKGPWCSISSLSSQVLLLDLLLQSIPQVVQRRSSSRTGTERIPLPFPCRPPSFARWAAPSFMRGAESSPYENSPLSQGISLHYRAL